MFFCLKMMFMLLLLATASVSNVYGFYGYLGDELWWWRSKAGLTAIPWNDVPTDAEHVNFADNQIREVPTGIFDHLYQVRILKLDHNELTAFPNLTLLGDTLEILHLFNNDLVYVNAEFLDPLVNLNTLYMPDNPHLSNFPPSEGLGTSLVNFAINKCNFKTLPDVTHMTKLNYFGFDGNPLKTISESEICALNSLDQLNAANLGIENFPNLLCASNSASDVDLNDNSKLAQVPIENAAALFEVTTLHIKNTKIEYLPPTCSKTPASLTIYASGSPLKLCECENAWLKQLSASGVIDVDDMDCSGVMWSALTLDGLLGRCKTSRPGKTTAGIILLD